MKCLVSERAPWTPTNQLRRQASAPAQNVGVVVGDPLELNAHKIRQASHPSDARHASAQGKPATRAAAPRTQSLGLPTVDVTPQCDHRHRPVNHLRASVAERAGWSGRWLRRGSGCGVDDDGVAEAFELRNRIVHGYWSIDLEILHSTALDDLPEFVIQLRKVLDELEA